MNGRGFSLIELMITLAIMGIVLSLGASSYQVWIGNVRIRTTGDAIQNGLQLMAVSQQVQWTVQGAVLVIAVVIDASISRHATNPT